MPIQAPTLQINGGVSDYQSLIAHENAQMANGMSGAGGCNFIASSATSYTLTNVAGNAIYQFTAGQAMTLTLDYAYNVCNTLPKPLSIGQQFSLQIVTNAATTIATPTLSSVETATVLAGTTAVLAASSRWYQGTLTQVSSTTAMVPTTGTTLTSLVQVGSTNAFTLTIAGNSVLPLVGQLVYLNVTAGTLPSGWYPICKPSATVPVIMTPAGTTWTMTAGTILGTQPAVPIYSPIYTLTGLWALVVSTASV